jgi:hypothetical protein
MMKWNPGSFPRDRISNPVSFCRAWPIFEHPDHPYVIIQCQGITNDRTDASARQSPL